MREMKGRDMDPVDHLMQIFATAGAARYGGEPVSQLDHALQCAVWAQAADADDGLVAAALLHDVGHLIYREPEAAMAEAVDDLHENRGAHLLAAWFPREVTEPVRLHVAAKRYLCVEDPGYLDRLSEGSKRSLELQGGPFTEREAASFIAQPFAEAAVRLRRWDEAAKVPEARTPDMESFRPLLESLLIRGGSGL